MWISNNDKEVECFHPICENALNEALKRLELHQKYEVQHHRHVGTIEMDLVVANKETDKILCVIEVKRTIAAVNSTRYQYQAMSYVQSLINGELESNYYILTNLESSCLFKYDINRPNPYEQIINPGLETNHRFYDVDKDTFIEDLTRQFVHYLTVISHDTGEYLLSFKQFANEIQNNLDCQTSWQKTLACLFYEYIRGSFSTINRSGMKSISQLSNKVNLVCQEGLKINFKDIFTLPTFQNKDNKISTSTALLKQLFELGHTYVDADELANVMHKVISNGHEHEGEVPTDVELANILLQLVKYFSGNLKPNEKIMDPAAGSGNLLCAAVNIFDDLHPSQLIANDINVKLLQLLSLRIGLKYAQTINKDDTACITTENIANLNTSLFDNVKCIVLNPPFLSAVSVGCVEKKGELYNRIRNLKGCEPITIAGQMPLEGVFIELTATLAQTDTIMAVILPNTHLTTKGEASVAIRKMLLNDFGLQMIFNYPQENLFDGVAQNTSIVIGIKGTKNDYIRYLYCNQMISEVDARNLTDILSNKLYDDKITSFDSDYEGFMLKRKTLEDNIEFGWHIGNSTKQEAIDFLFQHINNSSHLTPLSKSEYNNYKRGKIGNSGCTDLLFLKDNDNFVQNNIKLFSGHLSPGLNNAKFDKIDIRDGESYFFDVRGMDDKSIKTIITKFLKRENCTSMKQRKNSKTESDYFNILVKETKNITPTHSVMLPRMVRSNGRVFVNTKPTFVSTNFFIIQADESKAKILSSWLSTVFYQLECETFCNNRKGLRKMEKEDYEPLHVPITKSLSSEQIDAISNTKITNFINLRNPRPRDIDYVWARILFGEKSDDCLEKACSLLSILTANRES